MKINWLTIIANIYHWEKRIDNEIIVSIDIKLCERIRKKIGEMKYGK